MEDDGRSRRVESLNVLLLLHWNLDRAWSATKMVGLVEFEPSLEQTD